LSHRAGVVSSGEEKEVTYLSKWLKEVGKGCDEK